MKKILLCGLLLMSLLPVVSTYAKGPNCVCVRNKLTGYTVQYSYNDPISGTVKSDKIKGGMDNTDVLDAGSYSGINFTSIEIRSEANGMCSFKNLFLMPGDTIVYDGALGKPTCPVEGGTCHCN